MKHEIEVLISQACKRIYDGELRVVLTIPDPEFGDFACNVAFDLGAKLNKSPMDAAMELIELIKSELIKSLEVAKPGFINIRLSDQAVSDSFAKATEWAQVNKGMLELVEFGDPNPFKEMHLGHLYTSIVGDTIANLLQACGSDVKRLSYHGDVGPHVARAIWSIKHHINDDLSKLDGVLKAKPLGFYYAEGAQSYKDSEVSKAEIDTINQQIYSKNDQLINDIYDRGVKVSFEEFDKLFDKLGIKFDKRYLESESSQEGIKLVNANIGTVFKESEGAIVFEGEKVGLHTRVFVTSLNLPTYETKDLGLTVLKDEDYPKSDRSIVITAVEQKEYFKVMLAALKEIKPELARKTTHLSHGFLSLTTGKMSSRTGNVYTAVQLIDEVEKSIDKAYPDSEVKNDVFLASVKYTFLRQKIGNDIIFNTEESVSLDGNSGPYIQYAHARARSILSKAPKQNEDVLSGLAVHKIKLEDKERSLALKISQFTDVVENSINELMPHLICTYLYELAQEFNSFYENNRVINDPRMFTRLKLVDAYAEVLKSGLKILKIPAPVHM